MPWVKAMRIALRSAVLLPMVLGLSGCLNIFGASPGDGIPAAKRQLPAATQSQLAVKGMTQDAPIFIRIFKEDSELEVWKYKDGRFHHFKTYKICAWSGELGPKTQVGDRQAPEGFYTVSAGQLNPNSLYHLAFNVGFPNAHDRANRYTGSALMVHGNCKSVGCYAMTDAYIEEIYILARDALAAGQKHFHVQAFPFRMTASNMAAHRDSPWYPFWARLKEGYDYFEATGKPPIVKVCAKQYMVNVQFAGGGDPAPDSACPTYAKVDPDKMPGIEGVPNTLLASLAARSSGRGGNAVQPEIQTPQVAVASAPQQVSQPRVATAAPLTNMSASPVIMRQGEKEPVQTPTVATANMVPAKTHTVAHTGATPSTTPATTALVIGTPKPEQRQPVRATAAVTQQKPPVMASTVPLVQSQVTPAAFQPQTAPAQTGTFQAGGTAPVANGPSKFVDPNALQKPNRSGKGGKLSAPAPVDGQ